MSEKQEQPTKVETKTTEKAPAAVAKEVSSTVSKSKVPTKALMVGGIVVAVVAVLSGLVYWGMNSNTKIPVLSSVGSSVERSLFNSSKSVRKDNVEDIFKPYMDELEEYAGKEITAEEFQAIFMNDDRGEEVKKESVTTKGTLKVEISEEMMETGGSNMGEFTMNFDFDGYALVDMTKTRPVFEIDGTYSVAAEVAGEKVEGSADLKLVNEIFYGQIYDVVPDLGAEYEEMIGEWFSYDISEYYDQLEEAMKMMEEDSEEYADVMFEQEDLDMINEMLYSDAVLNSITYLDDRTIDDVQTKCMQYDFDEEDLFELVAIAAKYEDDYDEEETKEMIDEMRDEMEEAVGDGFNVVVETCTGRGDDLLYYASMEYKMDGIYAYMDIEYSDYGVEKDIEVPKDAQSLDALLEDMVPASNYNDVDFDDDDYDFDEDYDWSDYDFDEDYDWNDDSIDW